MSKKAQKRAARRRAQQQQAQQQRRQGGDPERAAELKRWRANKRRSEPRPEPEPQPWYLWQLGLTRECWQTEQPRRSQPPVIRRDRA